MQYGVRYCPTDTAIFVVFWVTVLSFKMILSTSSCDTYEWRDGLCPIRLSIPTKISSFLLCTNIFRYLVVQSIRFIIA